MKPFLFSVVIPALNEENYLPYCLQSIKSQSHRSPVNIIISDNGSTDNTLAIAKKYGCQIVTGSIKANIASARQLGCQKAKELAKKYPQYEEIIVNTDADTCLDSHFFSALKKVFSSPQIVAASGPIIINNKKFVIKKISQSVIRFFYLTLNLELKLPWLIKKSSGNYYLYGANACLRRSFYEKIGGWDTRFPKLEDLALVLKILKNNYHISYHPHLATTTSVRKFANFKGFPSLKKIYDYYFKNPDFKAGYQLIKKIYQ